jgi:acetyl-CoA C-acetyltransferase
MEDPLFRLGYKDFNPVAVDGAEVALEYGISREEQDEWAIRSHENYGKAYQQGKFSEEMFPVMIPQRRGDPKTLNIDEQYRADITLERLSTLPTIYGSATVTAGNAPGLNDGAAAVLFMTQARAQKLGLEPLAEIVAMSSIATETHRLADAPATAIETALKQADLDINDAHVIEINEAFAAVPLVSTKKLVDSDSAKWEQIKARTNINGGAIAIGHANTASGARIVTNLVYELRRRGGGIAVGAICGGLAQGDACVIRV